MLPSWVRTFSDPEEYQSAFIGASVEILPTRSGPFTALASRVELNRLWVARTRESAPRIKHAAQSPTRAFVSFLTQPGPELVTNGIAMPLSGLLRHSRAHVYHERSTGPTRWAVMSLPVEDMASAGAAITGRDLTPPRDPVRVIPCAAAMARLQDLHAAVEVLAEATPETLERPEVVRGLEQSLVASLVECEASAEPQEERWAQRCHETVMRRFRRVIDENHDQALYLPELCAAINVPERTLRLCCQEHLGMGPKQYLALRRVHLARRALRAADPRVATVTEIATRYGFWHFGRFAGLYRSLFGEAPSATLRHPPA
jgi:AraC-like DNA-binding protein